MSKLGEIISGIVADMASIISPDRQAEIEMMLSNEEDKEAEAAIREEIGVAAATNALTAEAAEKFIDLLDTLKSSIAA